MYEQTREGALALVLQIVTATVNLGSADVERLLESLQKAVHMRHVRMSADLFAALAACFAKCPAARDLFRTTGGFSCLMVALVSMEGLFAPEGRVSQQTVARADGIAVLDSEGACRSDETGGEEEIQTKSRPVQNEEGPPPSPSTRWLFPEDRLRLLTSVILVLVEALRDNEANRRYVADKLGYRSIGEALLQSGIMQTRHDHYLYGCMLALITLDPLMQAVLITPERQMECDDLFPLARSPPFVHGAVFIRNTQAVRSLVVLLVHSVRTLEMKVITAVHQLAMCNKKNQVELARVGLLGFLLRTYRTSVVDPADPDHDTVAPLVGRLGEYLFSTDDLRYFLGFLDPFKEPPLHLLEFMLHCIKYGRSPSFTQFNSAVYGYSGLALENIGERWPPVAGSGYTFMCWIMIESFDEGNVSAINLLSVSDSEQRSCLFIFVDPHARKLVLQTAVRQVSKFDKFVFQERVWYHICLVHARGRIAASTANLFVDGIFVDTMKVPYVGSPAPSPSVSAWIGVRPEKKHQCNLVWDLGPTYFLEDALEPDHVNIIYNLGPRYRSNFQDSLEKYQIYEIIDSVNLDFVNHGDDNGSELGHLYFADAHLPVSEERLLFAYHASSMRYRLKAASLPMDAPRTASLVAPISSSAGEVKDAILLNSAAPRERQHRELQAIIRGDYTIFCPGGIADALWKVGGMAILLKLIEQCNDHSVLNLSTMVLVEAIRFNWRNSEEMERIRGYETLAYILKKKPDLLSVELMGTLLVLVGRQPDNPNDAVISNPFAYKSLFLDFEVWRTADVLIQKAYIGQLFDFIRHSRKRAVNVARMGRMRMYLSHKLLTRCQLSCAKSF